MKVGAPLVGEIDCFAGNKQLPTCLAGVISDTVANPILRERSQKDSADYVMTSQRNVENE